MLEQLSQKVSVLAVLSALSISQSFANERPETIENDDEIIFTANRTATLASEVGSQSIVITEKEIQARQYHSATEALANQPGLILSQNGINGPSSIFIRGANSQNTLVLVDGVPLGDPMGTGRTVDFSMLGSLLDVNRIEVLKGPQSALYGSSAMGGVIQIFTNNLNQPGTKLRLMAGSKGTVQASATTTGQVGNLRYSLGGLIENVKGIDTTTDSSEKPHNDYDRDRNKNRQLSGKLNYLLTNELDLDFAFTYNDRYSDYDNFFNTTNFNDYNKSKLFTGRVALNGSFLEDQWTSTLAYSLMKSDRDDYSGSSFSPMGKTHYRYYGKTQTVNFDNELSFYDDFKTRFGLAYQKEQGSGDDRQKHSQNTKSIYVEQDLNFNDRFFNTVGIRYDKNSIFGSKTTYRLTSRYNFNEMFAVKGSFGTGFSAPNIYQLYGDYVGNTELKAETSRGYDVGLEFKPTNSSLIGISYFHTSYKNMIDYFEFPGTYTGEYRNLDRAKMKGFEVVGSWELNDQLALSGSYTYLDAKQKDPGKSYERMLRRPKHQVTGNVTYQPMTNLTLNASATYYSARKDVKDGKEVMLGSFTIIDITGSYKINNTFEVDAKIQNVLNKDYEFAKGYRERGRSAYIGVNISL
ncbi:TonB-dependent receptor plug domain-containing protein [Ignatzschineria sp. LJL83]